MIIVLEGIDNCGKTTITKMLYSYFSEINKNVYISKELTTKVGIIIKEMIKDKGMSPLLKTYLFAADRQIRMEKIIKEVDKFDFIVMDRYVYSAIVYRKAEGLEGDWVKTVNKIFPKADMAFYIDITGKESIKRNTTKKFNIKYTEKFLEEVRNNYLYYCDINELIFVNGMQKIEDVYNIIIHKIVQQLEKQ